MKKYEKEQKDFDRKKKNISEAYQYFKPCYESYHSSRNFVFNSSLNDSDKTKLQLLNKPDLEFNILESPISRLRGEFIKQRPSILVSGATGMKINEKLIDFVQGRILFIMQEANNNSFDYDVYTDIMSGGFSVMKYWTEYVDPMSFELKQCIGRAYDPTLCGFDPLARYSHKGDGRFCFELYPRTKEEFKRAFPKIDISELSYNRSPGGEFSWCYRTSMEDILLIADYYEKRAKEEVIYKLSNGRSILKSKYELYQALWEEKAAADGIIEQRAIIVDERETTLEQIVRTKMIGNKIIDERETTLKRLPLIFVDGNSVLLRQGIMGPVQQLTRAYVYHAIGLQKLKNFSGQTLANGLENMIQSKLKVAAETLPVDNEDYLNAYTNPQQAAMFIYNSMQDGDSTKPLPPPMEVQQMPMPPEVMGTFQLCDEAMKMILGNFDASLGINDNQLSGLAIMEGATQSNSAAMPYVVGYLQGLNQLAQIIVEDMPNVHPNEMILPVITKQDSRDYISVNKRMQDGTNKISPDSLDLTYEPHELEVKVEAGINFGIQKTRTLQQIGVMMQGSQTFSEFINEKGLDVLIKNMEVHGADQLEEKAKEFMQEKAQQKQMMMKQLQAQLQSAIAGQQNNPAIMRNMNEAKKIDASIKQNDVKNQLDAGQQAIDQERVINDRMKILSEAESTHHERAIREAQIETERMGQQVELGIAVAHESHRQHGENRKHGREEMKLLHDIHQSTVRKEESL